MEVIFEPSVSRSTAMTTRVLAFLWLLGILGLASVSAADCARMYRYSYWGQPYLDTTIQIHVPDTGSTWGTIFMASDVRMQIEFCGSDSEYFCFIPYFAVPKHLDGSMRKWTVRDTAFEVVREGMMVQLLGRRLDGVYLIVASPLKESALMKEPWEFLYSPSSGLVGLRAHRASNTGWGVAWVADAAGFGASDPGPESYPSTYRNQNLCPKSGPGR